MTEKQRNAIERARRTPATFIEIERTTRFTAHRNTMKALRLKQAERITALLETEQQRLIKTWRDQ